VGKSGVLEHKSGSISDAGHRQTDGHHAIAIPRFALKYISLSLSRERVKKT